MIIKAVRIETSKILGCECDSVVKPLSRMHEALGATPSTTKEKPLLGVIERGKLNRKSLVMSQVALHIGPGVTLPSTFHSLLPCLSHSARLLHSWCSGSFLSFFFSLPPSKSASTGVPNSSRRSTYPYLIYELYSDFSPTGLPSPRQVKDVFEYLFSCP